MASYPATVPTLGTYTGADHPQVSHNNTPNDEIEAICAELGLNPKSIDDTVAPASSPASVAAYLDMAGTIVRTMSGLSAWHRAAVPARLSFHGHGNGQTVPLGATRYPILFGQGLSTVQNLSETIHTFSCIVEMHTFWIHLLTAMGSDINDYMPVGLYKNGTNIRSIIVPAGTPAGLFNAFSSRSPALNEISYAVNDNMGVAFGNNGAGSGASGQIGAWGFEARLNG